MQAAHRVAHSHHRLPTSALSGRGEARVTSVSCGSAGNCAAGGHYTDRHGHLQGFVAVERHGRWGTAIEVPGLAALNKRDAQVTSVSCGSAGNCAAGGFYDSRSSGHGEGFVAVERHGRWGTAIEVPGLAALNTGNDAAVTSVSCAPAGSCAAGGDYHVGEAGRGFVAVERHGRWGTAIEVPGLAALNEGDAQVSAVSCGAAGNCAAGGLYDTRTSGQAFVAVERHGRWGTAIEVPGLGALNTGGFAHVYSVSCGAAGSCAAGGDYEDRHFNTDGFVAVLRNGRWAKAIEVPGLGALNTGGEAEVDSVSCASAGNCAAGGLYVTRGHSQGFVAVETNGAWGTAIEVPGLAALNKGDAYLNSVSCGSAGNCAAGGSYTDRHGQLQGFVAVETNGAWGTAIEVPGLAALDKGQYGAVNSVSCAPVGDCVAGGTYRRLRPFPGFHGFVT